MSIKASGVLEINWAEAREKTKQKTASLEEALSRTVEPRERVDLLVALAEHLRAWDVERTGALLREAFDLAKSVDYKEGWSFSLAELVRYSMSDTEMEAALRLSFAADNLLKDCPPSLALTNARLQIGWMYYFFGDYSMAMDWALKGIELVTEFGSLAIHSRLLDLIACVHSQMTDHAAALSQHAKAVEMGEKTGDLVIYSSILNNFAMSYFEAGDLEHGLEISRISVEIGREMEMTRLIQNYYDTEGEILLAMGRLDEAEAALKEALELTHNIPLNISRGFITRTLGKVYLAWGKLDLAADYLQQSIDIMADLNLKGSLAHGQKLMSTLLEQKNDFAGALEHYKKYNELRESTAGQEPSRRQEAMKTSYEIQLAHRDAEIERLHNIELRAEIEERKHIQSVLEILATTDMLTNLTNRHQFFILAEREVERSLRYNHPLALLIVDIDYFKRVNDTLGHIAGDQVLVAIGKAIREALRNVDIAGRYGGEEFCVLLPEISLDGALRAAERLRGLIAEMGVSTDRGKVSVTVSIGVAGLRGNVDATAENIAARELAALLDHADQALYDAKQSGRNTVRSYKA